MFDDILKAVKDHFAENPEIANAIPAEHHDAVHNEIATQITNGLSAQGGETGGFGGILEKLENQITSGNPIVNAIGGGLVGSLASKLGLGSAAAGALAASLPALLEKFAHKPSTPA